MRLRFRELILIVLTTKQSGWHLAWAELEVYLLMKKKAALFHPKLWEENLYTEMHDFFNNMEDTRIDISITTPGTKECDPSPHP